MTSVTVSGVAESFTPCLCLCLFSHAAGGDVLPLGGKQRASRGSNAQPVLKEEVFARGVAVGSVVMPQEAKVCSRLVAGEERGL